jgi:alanine-glyoxylate transaminase/serine-glyoxylate transaminase/serine-pyruvate transaminase
VNSLYALHESLLILQEEGLQNAWDRHALNHEALVAGLESLGLKFVVDKKYRLPQLNAVSFPASIDDLAIRTALLNDYNLEIGSGLGALAGSVWRIGLMGFASNKNNVLLCVSALGNVLAAQGIQIDVSKAVSSAQAVYSV